MGTALPPGTHPGQPPPRGAYYHPSPSKVIASGPSASAPLRALQLLRETQPLPVRRQSVPAGSLLPRGPAPPPPLSHESKTALVKKPPAPFTHPSLVGEPPPPAANRAIASASEERRHSTGSFDRVSTLGTARPPPPRGPPPLSFSSVTTGGASGGVNPLQVAREDLRRRSSGFRGPPPGPPPPGRRWSVTLPSPSGSSPKPIESLLKPRPAQPHQEALMLSKATPTAVGVTGGAQEPEEAGSRRVSFSAYRGKPTHGRPSEDSNGQEKNTQGDIRAGVREPSDLDGHRGGEESTDGVASVPRPLPQLQRQPASSQTTDAPGRPPPPRPVGDPPTGQLRRYSIANELMGDFSRRLSTAVAPSKEPSDTTTGEGGNNIPRVSTDNSGSASSPSLGNGGGKQPLPRRASVEGRPAVLWYNMGVTKQKEQDVIGAVEFYERAAREGHAKAQHNLAAIYEKGAPGVPKDDAEAVRLFQLAADQSLAESCYSLAMHLKFGLGIEQDDARCVYYLEQASENGLAKAMFNLGLMYEKHRGVSSDASEVDLMEATRECYQAAAESGITKAMVNLGVLYMSGRLPGREPGGALEWFKKAADGGDVSGLWNLSLCYERGLGVARDPLAAQALQQQCRDRERENQRRRGPSVVGAVALGVGARSGRRSSEPVVPSMPSPIEGGNGPAADSGRPKPRLRSSSVSSLPHPRPQGTPPGRTTKLDRRQDQIPEKAEFEGPAAVSIGSSGHTHVRTEDPSTGRRLSASVGRPAAEGAAEGPAVAASASLDTPNRFSPPPRERKDSLMLKPTPLAIARVKAAVERRKRLELAEMSSTVADGLGGGK